METTTVVFRKFKDNGHIIALFPYEPATRDGRHCESYMHVGQHSAADYSGVIQQTKPATEAEYADLKRELESKPYEYKFSVRKRVNPQSAHVVRARKAK